VCERLFRSHIVGRQMLPFAKKNFSSAEIGKIGLFSGWGYSPLWCPLVSFFLIRQSQTKGLWGLKVSPVGFSWTTGGEAPYLFIRALIVLGRRTYPPSR